MGEIREQPQIKPFKDVLKDLDSKISEGVIKPSEALEYSRVIRAKYHLPNQALLRFDPKRFIDEIEITAKQNNIKFRPGYEFQLFFKEFPEAGAVSFESSVFRPATIITKEGKVDNYEELYLKALTYAHEIVHALQAQKYPNMPEEEQEREAYYYEYIDENMLMRFKDDPNKLDYFLNTYLETMIKASSIVDKKI